MSRPTATAWLGNDGLQLAAPSRAAAFHAFHQSIGGDQMNLQPLNDRVVVKPKTREETTKGGIVLPDTAKEKPQEGTIVAAGPGRVLEDGTRIPLDVKVGDNVLYAKYAGTEYRLNDEELLILKESDILATVG
jgi:chaperonin GroES